MRKVVLVKRDKGYWLNTKYIKEPNAIKPCHKCGVCPYGQLVEEYPFSETKRSCKVFGHDCPAFYLTEGWSEKRW